MGPQQKASNSMAWKRRLHHGAFFKYTKQKPAGTVRLKVRKLAVGTGLR